MLGGLRGLMDERIILNANGAVADLALLQSNDLAIQVQGSASTAWLPRLAIDDRGNIASWFIPSPEQINLFNIP